LAGWISTKCCGTKENELLFGLFVAFSISFLVVYGFYAAGRTKCVIRGKVQKTEYSKALHGEFRSENAFFREMSMGESSLYVLLVNFLANETQLAVLTIFHMVVAIGFLYLWPFRENSLNQNLVLGKVSFTAVIFFAWIRIYHGFWPDGAMYAPFSLVVLYLLHTIYLMDFPKVVRSYRQFKRENLPKIQVAAFTRKNRMRYRGVRRWNSIHMENLSIDQRGWIVMYHIPVLIKKWSVFDTGPGANGEFLAKMRGNTLQQEFILSDKERPGGLKILRAWDLPGVYQIPEGLEKAKGLEEVAFGQCANCRGPIIDFGRKFFPKLWKVNFDETRVYDPIYTSETGLGDRYEMIVFNHAAPYWDEVPKSIEDFRENKGAQYLVNGCKITVHKVKLLDWVEEDYALQFYTTHTHPIWEVPQQEGWTNGRYLEFFKDTKRFSKDKKKDDDGSLLKVNIDCHFNTAVISYRWPHIQQFKWSYGVEKDISMRIEMIHRVGGTGAELPRVLQDGA